MLLLERNRVYVVSLLRGKWICRSQVVKHLKKNEIEVRGNTSKCITDSCCFDKMIQNVISQLYNFFFRFFYPQKFNSIKGLFYIIKTNIDTYYLLLSAYICVNAVYRPKTLYLTVVINYPCVLGKELGQRAAADVGPRCVSVYSWKLDRFGEESSCDCGGGRGLCCLCGSQTFSYISKDESGNRRAVSRLE